LKAREKILKTADRLFYQNGIRAVGVDTIVSEAGIAKATLYNHFPSKNDLIIGYLDSMNCKISGDLDKGCITLADFFKNFFDYLNNNEELHCPFISAMSEFTNENDEVRKAAVNYKKKSFEFLKNMAEKENLKNPEEVANQLMMIQNGVTIQRQIFGKDYDTKPVMNLVNTIINSYK
jgi:AcrR family transcriptional regulator